jgi:orotidine-5'-phosphate decarboxylase
VGIDPHPELLAAWGLEPGAGGLRQFTDICVKALAGHAAIVKPQVAFYEAYGSAGFAVLEDALSALRAAGTLVLADAKRGDIGSTMAAYAQAWLATGPLAADALTVSPFLGFGSLEPALALAESNGRGLIVLAATTGTGGAYLHQSVTPDGKTISQAIVDEAAARNAGADPLGPVGVVVGTTNAQAPDVRQLNGVILMPGVGHQGGGPEDLRRLLGGVRAGVLPSASRSVLGAGPSVAAVRDAAARLQDEFAFLVG